MEQAREDAARTFVGEWTFTGDKYVRDAEGYYHYRGRTDDMFKVGGIWVSPFEVEAALASHAAVLEAAVVGQEDDDGLMKPKASSCSSRVTSSTRCWWWRCRRT